MKYLGRMDSCDPLHAYLGEHIFPQLHVEQLYPQFRVFQFPASNGVFLYEETRSQRKVIGKFFNRVDKDPQQAWDHAHNEWQHMHALRDLGFQSGRLYVPQPLGISRELSGVIMEEFCPGQSLSGVISESIDRNNPALLYARLTGLACFLAKLHNRTARAETVRFDGHFAYFDKIMARLQRRHRISARQTGELYHYRDRWQQLGCMWSDRQVLVHGDATPSNFLFAPLAGSGSNAGCSPRAGCNPRRTIAIDLERMRLADRAYDLGMVAGELKHHFMRTTHHGGHAEPFIGHFLWEYSTHFPDRHAAFASATERVPFYMGMTLLRIARNSWLDWHYSQALVHEAIHILRR
jgi:aminoglycoside phosphotransferase (APT) family kinase protein